MENVSISTKVLNGFLTLMVGVLICIISAIAVCLILSGIGVV